jgi:hypothetical protein
MLTTEEVGFLFAPPRRYVIRTNGKKSPVVGQNSFRRGEMRVLDWITDYGE